MTRDWVTIGTFDDPHDAEWEASRLREVGINARVHDPWADEYDPDPTADIRVLVEPKDVERARTVLASDNEVPEEPEPEDDEPPAVDEPPPPPPSERAESLESAHRAAVVGILFPPMILWSMGLIVTAFQKPGPTGRTGLFWLAVTVLLNLGTVVAWSLVVPGFFR